MQTTTVGSLALVTETADKRQLERELKKLDPHLFIDFEADPQYGLIPLVKLWVGLSRPEGHIVVRWQEPDGRPKPLCWALVEQVKRQDGAAATSVQEAIAHNERLRQGLRDRADDDYSTIEGEHRSRIRAAQLDSLPPGWRPKHFGKK